MMSFSYSGDPAGSTLDECRFLINDTDSNNPILQDEEIDYIISKSTGNENLLKYNLFTQAATMFARAIKRSLGPQSEDPTARLNFYNAQAEIYKAKIASSGVSLPSYAYPKIFRKGMHSNPPIVIHVAGGRYVR